MYIPNQKRQNFISVFNMPPRKYIQTYRIEEAKELLLLAYDRHPGGRTIVYSLCELSIKLGEFVQAIEYYKEFVQIAPKDTGRYVLQYKLYVAQV